MKKVDSLDFGIRITGNVREIYEKEKSSPEFQKSKKFGSTIKCALYQLIGLHETVLLSSDEEDYTRQDIISNLFEGKTFAEGMTLAEGVDKYKAMFKNLKELKGAEKYKKQLTAFINWLTAMKKYDKTLETQIDLNLIDRCATDEPLLRHLIDKYEHVYTR